MARLRTPFVPVDTVLSMRIQSHQANIHQLSMQRKCQSCFCRYLSTIHHPDLEASSPLLTALKSCRTRDFMLLGGQGKDTTWVGGAGLTAETPSLSAWRQKSHEEPWQSRAERLLLVMLEEPQALWKQILVVCVCPWPLHKERSGAGQHCSCLTGLSTELGLTGKHQELLPVPHQGNTNKTSIPVLLCN